MASEQAYQQALQELGSPVMVSAELNKVHNMQKLVLVGLSLFLAGSLGVYAWSEQPEVQKVDIQTNLKVKCVASKNAGKAHSVHDICDRSKTYTRQIAHFVVHLDVIKPLLESKNLVIGNIQEQDGALKAYTPKNSGKIGYADYEMPVYHGIDGDKYVDARSLIDMNTKDVKIRGFERVFVTSEVANIELPIKKENIAWDLYHHYTLKLSMDLFKSHEKFKGEPSKNIRTGFESGKGESNIEVKTSYQKNQIVALFTMNNQKMFPKNQEKILTVQHYMAKVDENGVARFKTAAPKYHFVREINDLKLTTETKLPTALLVKVSGIPLNQGQKGIFTPQQSRATQ